jgi:hypothetical protein
MIVVWWKHASAQGCKLAANGKFPEGLSKVFPESVQNFSHYFQRYLLINKSFLSFCEQFWS